MDYSLLLGIEEANGNNQDLFENIENSLNKYRKEETSMISSVLLKSTFIEEDLMIQRTSIKN
jgi:hypothetical protein